VALTVGDIADHPVVRRGDPVVLAGRRSLGLPVRWVHSSDIYEMGPLLRPGDLLLTTGLGLEPREPAERREFLRHLARAGASGVVLELCRFFTAAPQEMVAEAERIGLPLVGLRAVVPFVEVTQAVNELLVDGAVHRLRRADEISRALSSALAAGRDLPALLGELARRLARPVRLVTAAGGVLDAGRRRGGPAEEPLPRVEVPVLLHGSVEAWLSGPEGDDGELVADVLERVAGTFALALLRGSTDRGAGPVARRRLVAALLDGDGAAEVAALARAAGLPDDGVRAVVAVAPGSADGRAVGLLDAAARRAAAALRAPGRGEPGTALAAEVDGTVCVVLASRAPSRRTATELRDQLAAALAGFPDRVHAVVGPEVGTLEELSRSVAEARRLLGSVAVLPGPGPVHDAAELGPERALLAGWSRAELAGYAQEQLGPLLDADARGGGQLLVTLEALLGSPEGKAEAARRLRIQRQTLYQRLERIEAALGADLTDGKVRASLLLALRAHALVRPAGR
jgi:purine catabolism regulator